MRATFRALLAPDASAVLRRFPVAVLAAAALAFLGASSWRSTAVDAAWFAWTVTLMAAIAIGIWTEGRGGRGGAQLQGVALALGAAAYFGHASSYVSTLWSLAALAVAILAAAAPGRDEQELWSFDARLVALLVFALVATSVVVLGLIAICAAAEYLFDLKLASAWSESIVRIGYSFVFPVYWCALLPRPEQPRLAPDDLLFKAAVVLGALLAIVVTALAALLHFYAARIALGGDMPKNQVGWIVSVALLAGLLAWLLSAGESGPAARLRTLFRRLWLPLTLAPAALLAVAISRRIEAYGVTSDRYAVVVAGAVSIALLGLLVLNRFRPPPLARVLAAGLLAATVAAVGPQSMPNVVASSQMARLKEVLAGANLLVDGRLAAAIPTERWTRERKREIETIVEAIVSSGAVDRLAALAPSLKIAGAYDARAALGTVEQGRPGPELSGFTVKEGAAAFQDGRLVGDVSLTCRSTEATSPAGQTRGDVSFVLGPRELVARWPGGATTFDIAALAAFTGAEKEKERPNSVASADGRSLLLIQSVTFRTVGGRTQACGVEGAAVLRPQ